MLSVRAYDLVVGTVEQAQARRPDGPDPVDAGWSGPDGPAIDPRTWPRSPRTGQPLHHCATFTLPEEYRRRGPDLVAVSVFDWSDQWGFADPLPHVVAARGGDVSGVPEPLDPFWADLARSRPHPHAHVVCDPDTGAFYALLHLTAAELHGPRTQRPRQGPVLGEHEGDDESERTRLGLFGTVWLVERDDPYAGLPPVDWQLLLDDEDDDVPGPFERFSTSHVGGTFMDPGGPGRRTSISPWYLEVHRFGGMWVGDDENLVVDLDADPPILFR